MSVVVGFVRMQSKRQLRRLRRGVMGESWNQSFEVKGRVVIFSASKHSKGRLLETVFVPVWPPEMVEIARFCRYWCFKAILVEKKWSGDFGSNAFGLQLKRYN